MDYYHFKLCNFLSVQLDECITLLQLYSSWVTHALYVLVIIPHFKFYYVLCNVYIFLLITFIIWNNETQWYFHFSQKRQKLNQKIQLSLILLRFHWSKFVFNNYLFTKFNAYNIVNTIMHLKIKTILQLLINSFNTYGIFIILILYNKIILIIQKQNAKNWYYNRSHKM